MQELNSDMLLSIRQTKRISTQAVNLILMGCFAILILLRDIGGVIVDRAIFISLATIICLLSNKSGIYCLLAFLTPLAPGISTTYITAIALVIMFFKQRQIRVQILGLSCMAALLLIELISGFRGMFNIIDYLRFSGVFLFAFLRMIDLKDDYNNEAILHSYLIGFWLAMTSVLGQMINSYPVIEVLRLGVRFGNTRELLDVSKEGMLVSYNPNGLGYLCLLTALFCLLLYRKNKRIAYLLSFCGATFLGIMTQSRAFLLSYAIGIVLYTIFSCRNVKTAIRSLLSLAAGGGAVIALAIWTLPEYVTNFVLRFQDYDLLNGRSSISAYYFKEMFQHADRILFGVGMQNYPEKYGYLISAHNATQEVMITWGLLGLAVVGILFVVTLFNASSLNPKIKIIQFLPILMYLIAIQSGQGFSDTAGMLRIMVAYSAILLKTENTLLKINTPNYNIQGSSRNV